MPARLSLIAFTALMLVTGPGHAKDKAGSEPFACTGAFAMDSSEARLIALYGAENVWSGMVPGPEGTELPATRVFPDDPERMLEFYWWDEKNRTDLGNVDLPPSITGPGGVRTGMSVAEVAALNGAPFTLSGFGWDYGGFAGFPEGNLSKFDGDCALSLRFSPGDDPVKQNTDAIYGDREVPSTEPLLEIVGAYVEAIAIGYPHPDFR